MVLSGQLGILENGTNLCRQVPPVNPAAPAARKSVPALVVDQCGDASLPFGAVVDSEELAQP